MKKKFLSTLIIGGIICSSSTIALAKENPKSIAHENTTINSMSNKINSKDSSDLETLKKVFSSIKEMREADYILNNDDLTKKDTYNKMLVLASTSLDRIRILKDKNLTEELNTHIDFISSMGEEVRIGCNNLNNLNSTIKNVEKVLSSDKEYSNEEKETALYALKNIIVKNEKEESLNKKTLSTAYNILNTYTKIFDNSKKESSYNIEQMNSAIKDMEEACNLLDNSDLSKLTNYEKMIRLSTASLNKAKSLKLNKNSELKCHLHWIDQSGDSIRNTTASLNNLITAIKKEKEIFAPYSHATIEEKKTTLSKLDDLINKEEVKNQLNKTTLENVKKLVADYTNQLNDDITNMTSSSITNNKVDSAVGSDSITETDLDNIKTTSTETNLNNTTTTETQTNINVGTDASTETDLDNTKTVGTETNLNNTTTTETQTNINVGTDNKTNKNIKESHTIDHKLKDDSSTDIKTEVITVPVNNKITTSVKTDVIKNKTDVTSEVNKYNNVTIGTEKKSINKINKVTTPVSAVATQTDIAPVSAVATQTDIAPVSTVATQTDTCTETKNVISSVKNEITNKKEQIKDTTSNKDKKEVTEPIKEVKSKTKKSKKTSCGLLGLGLLSTLVCALLKKFI
ncbi:hypothetical protein [Clostridium tarantellae]|uniref:LPXTG cell wall anchor domain-containing protein n=1 Tax=Clostridium tarantellae TaxID=39493 RepID=A0A6I1MPK8_9CLOT|nr:hypothetical protein [Clostridium tarantellae]MPQ45004.1 hypothetical protein [Clostridium tarantellae]